MRGEEIDVLFLEITLCTRFEEGVCKTSGEPTRYNLK
jgi:hypothetical protein